MVKNSQVPFTHLSLMLTSHMPQLQKPGLLVFPVSGKMLLAIYFASLVFSHYLMESCTFDKYVPEVALFPVCCVYEVHGVVESYRKTFHFYLLVRVLSDWLSIAKLLFFLSNDLTLRLYKYPISLHTFPPLFPTHFSNHQ